MTAQKEINDQIFKNTLNILSDLIKFQTESGKSNLKLIEYCENGNDHDKKPLSINLKYIDKDINLKFYSRNRQINQESSMSVLGW